ncbi:hypothetical protein L1987_32968 [Smallanthus sonchifolius]|uniref:Uncharacterized protein n=1 Tax=Smallanthus sonchifolius TaxID=185202 RepID=A0ACB9HRE4_9ASTR|nr:hypothetical protein L1987_32968 [Smallanthus sonchifolius]
MVTGGSNGGEREDGKDIETRPGLLRLWFGFLAKAVFRLGFSASLRHLRLRRSVSPAKIPFKPTPFS